MEQVVYDILAILIIVVAVGIVIKKVIDKILPTKKSACESGCGGCATPCDLKEIIKHQIK